MNSEDTWEPVALIPATLSDENGTTMEVIETRGGIYLHAMEPDSDLPARDCCMTKDEARRLAFAILAATDPEPTAVAPTGTVANLRTGRRSGAMVGSSAYLQAAA